MRCGGVEAVNTNVSVVVVGDGQGDHVDRHVGMVDELCAKVILCE